MEVMHGWTIRATQPLFSVNHWGTLRYSGYSDRQDKVTGTSLPTSRPYFEYRVDATLEKKEKKSTQLTTYLQDVRSSRLLRFCTCIHT